MRNVRSHTRLNPRAVFGLALTMVLLLASCTPAAPSAPPAQRPSAPAPQAQAPAPPPPQPTAAPAKPVQPVTLSVTAAQPAGITASQAVKWFGDELEKRSDGGLKFQYHWAGSLTKAGEELDAVAKRLADIGNIAVVYYPAKLELANWTYAVPFGPADPALMVKITRQMYDQVPELRNELESNNLKILFYIAVGTNDLSTQKPVSTLDDLKGLKVGAVGKYLPKAIEVLGATPVVVAAPDKYQALQTKLINADMMPYTFTDTYKLYEMNKYLVGVDFGANFVWALGVNKDAWNSLSPERQKMIEAVALEAEAYGAKIEADGRQKAIDNMNGKGATYTPLSFEQKQRWASMMPNFPQEWVTEMEAKGKPGKKIMQKYIELVAQSGHKWPRVWDIK